MKNAMIKTGLLLMLYFFVQLSFSQQPLDYIYTNQLGGEDIEYIVNLATDNDKNVIVLLKTLSNELYWNDSLIGNEAGTYLMKFSETGGIVFNTPLIVEGDNAFIDISQIEVLENGEIVLPGTFYGTLHFGNTLIQHPVVQGFICKFQADGTPEVINDLVISPGHVVARQLAIDQNNDIYLAGGSLDTMYFDQNNDTIYAPYGTFKLPVIKLDADLNLIWLKVFYTDGTLVGKHPIAIDGDNNLILASMFDGYNLYYGDQTFQFASEHHMLFARITSSGELLWAKTAEAMFTSLGYTLCSDPNNNIYFSSQLNYSFTYDTITVNSNGTGDAVAIILSLDENGDFRWYNRIRDITTWPVEIPPNKIRVKDNNVYVGGEYKTNSWCGNIYLQSVSLGYDCFLANFDADSGDCQWVQGFYGNKIYFSNIFSFAFGPEKNIYLSGQFTGVGMFGNQELSSYGSADVFISRLNETFVGVNDATAGSSAVVFPNPGSAKLSIQITEINVSFKLYNQSGQLVMNKELHQSGTQSIETSSLPGGLYFYQLTGRDGNQETGKWIKQ